MNSTPQYSPPRPEPKRDQNRSEINNHIPYRSAGGASTGSFATPRMLNHFVPSSPPRFSSVAKNEFHRNGNRNDNHGMNGSHGKPCVEGEQEQEQEQEQHLDGIEKDAKSLIPNDEREENTNAEKICQDESDHNELKCSTSLDRNKDDNEEENINANKTCQDESDRNEANYSFSLDRNEDDNEGKFIIADQEKESNDSVTNQNQVEQNDLNGSHANTPNYLHLDEINHENSDCASENDEDSISKINVSFSSEFSCEVEKLTLLQNKSDAISPIKSQGLKEENEGSSCSGSDWSDEGGDSSEDSDCEQRYSEGEGERSLLNTNGSNANDHFDESIHSSSASEMIENCNALGAMRPPWTQDYESSIGSSTMTSFNENVSQRIQKSDLNQTDAGRNSEEGMDAPLESPWAKYLESDGKFHQQTDSDLNSLDSSGYVSSITNQSCLTHLSSSTCASMQSPTLQHLEYLARNSTAAYVATFTPRERQTSRVPFASPLKKASERLTQKELNDIYGCKTRRDAMKLAFDQSNCLGQASTLLVDLLFEYLQKFCDVPTQQLFADGDEGNVVSSNNSSENGLSLPASAVGWLSSYLFPDEGDRRYHQQWESVQEEYCLPNASPAPQLQSKLSLLKVMLQKHVTHLRIINKPWPGRPKKGKANFHSQSYESPRRRGRMLLNFDADSTSAFLRFYRLLQNQPRVDMRLFPRVEYVNFEGIPPEWIHNLKAANSSLSRLTIQKGCLLNLSRLLEVQDRDLPIGNGKKVFDQSHGAVFEDGIYDSILHVTTQQWSPVVKIPPSLQGKEENDMNYGDALEGKELDLDTNILPMLKHLTLSSCGMIDSSLCLRQDSVRSLRADNNSVLSALQGLESIDMSHNDLTHAKSAFSGLSYATRLVAIDVSYNKFSSMDGSNMLLGNIKVLLLSNNNISDVCGLDRMYSLERLDLKHNRISNLCDVSALAKLPNLMRLDLRGNPLVAKGKKKYRAHMLSLFKESRIQDNGIGLTYRQLMELLPTLDGSVVTKKEMVMLKYLSFTQSFRKDCPANCGQPTRREESADDDGLDNVQRCELLRPFAEDFRDEGRVEPASSVVVPMQAIRRRVTRKTTYKPAIIGCAVNGEILQMKGFVQRKKCSTVRLERRAPSTLEPGIYLLLENVIESITKCNTEESSSVKSQTLSQDRSEGNDYSKSCESYESSRSNPEDQRSHEITSLVESKGGDPCEESVESGDDEECHKLSGKIVDVLDEASDINFNENRSVESMASFNNDIADDVSTCPTEIVKNISTVQDNGIFESEQNTLAAGSEEDEFGLLNTTNYSSAADLSDDKDENEQLDANKSNCIDFAAAERNDEFDGPDAYSQLFISEYYELYFRCFVFPSTSHNDSIELYGDTQNQEPTVPKVQLYQSDRDLMMWALTHKKQQQDISSLLHAVDEEKLISVKRELVLPCGVAATARIQPTSSDVRGSKGTILFNTGSPYSISEGQNLLFCISNRAIYLIPDFVDAYSDSRRFPSSIPSDAQFSSGLWPHAYCRHPLKHLRKISFDGYGFQRLTLFFKLPGLRQALYAQPENALMSAFDYTYVIFTFDQQHTIKMLQCLQEAAKEASPNDVDDLSSSSLVVENDNSGTMKAIARTLARANFTDDILHYQIVFQLWDNNDHHARRSFVLTNSEVFLFIETYAGDLSGCTLEGDISDIRYGDISMRTIASCHVKDIATVSSAKDNTKMVTIAFKSQSRLSWSSSAWLLKCQNVDNAERLISDIRKVLST